MSTTNQITINSLFYQVSGAQIQYTSTTDILTRNGGTNGTEILYINNSDKAETLLTDFKITHSFTISSNSRPLYVKSGTAINVKSEIVNNVNTIGILNCNQCIYLQNKSIDSDGNDVNPGLINIDGGKLNMQTDIKGYKGVIEPFNNCKISTSDKNDYGIIQIENGILDLKNTEYHFYDIQLLLNKVMLHDIITSGKKFVFENSFIDFKSKSPRIITGIYSESNTRKFEFTNCDIIGEINSKLFDSNTDDIELNVTLINSKVNLTQSNENLTNYSIKFTNLTSKQSEIINTFDEAYRLRVYFNGATFTDTKFKFLNGMFGVGKSTTMDEGIKMDGEGSFGCVNSIIYLGGIDASDNKGKLTIDLPYPIYLKSCNIKLNPESSLKINECIDVLPMCFLDRNSNISIDLVEDIDNYTAVDFSTDTKKHYLSELGIYIDKGALSGINSKITILEKDSQLYGDQLGIIRSKIGIDIKGDKLTGDSYKTSILNRLDRTESNIGIDNEGNKLTGDSYKTTMLNRLDDHDSRINEHNSRINVNKNNISTNTTQIGYLKTNVGINDLGVQQKGDSYKTSILNRLDRTESNIGIDNKGDKLTGDSYKTTMLNRLDHTESNIGIDNEGNKLTGDSYKTTMLNRLDDHDSRINEHNSRINVNKNNISTNTTQIGYLKTNVGINDNGNQTPSTNNEETETMLNRLDHIQKTIGIDNLGVQDNTINNNSVLIRLDNYKIKISTNTTQIGYLKTNVGINDNGEPIQSTDPNKPNILERLGINETQIGYLKTNVGINDNGNQTPSTNNEETETMLNRLDHIQKTIGIDNLGVQDNTINNNSVLIRLDNYKIKISTNTTQIGYLKTNVGINDNGEPIQSTDPNKPNILERLGINETQIGYLKTNVGINDLGVQQKGDSYKTSILNRLDRTESNIGIDNEGNKLTGEDYESTILYRLDTTEYDIDMLYDYDNALSEVLDVEGVKKLLEKKNYEFNDVLKYIVDIIENRHSDLRSINMKMLILSILANKQKFLNN